MQPFDQGPHRVVQRFGLDVDLAPGIEGEGVQVPAIEGIKP